MQPDTEKDYTSKFNAGLWRRIFASVRETRGDFARLSVCMALTAIGDILFPLMTARAIDGFVTPQTTQGLGGFIALYLLLIVVQASAIFGFQWFASRVEVNVNFQLRVKAFQKLQELSFSFYDKTPVGYLLSRMTGDASRLGETIGWVLLDIIWAVIGLVFTIAVMLILNARLALMILLVIPPLAVISWFFQQKILRAHRAVRKTNSRITGAFNEGIMGAKTTKTLVREEQNEKEFRELTGEMRRHSVRAASLSALYLPLVIALGSIATAYALVRGGQLALAGGMTLGTLQVFVSYTVQMFEPVRAIASALSEMQSAQAAGERVMDLLDAQPDITDTPEVISLYGDSFAPRTENWPTIRGEITFDHVSFQYKNGESVLEDFSLHVQSGETIALVGPTGAGKSTIVNLVCRFYEPTKGTVLVDGTDYTTRSQLWLQSHLGYVLQEPQLFSGSIRDNIRYGRLTATDEEVERAARMVNAEGFILNMEKGYDTDVGEGGSRLSTGEKQLISLARALLSDPAIFILDEATSSVDTATEQIIQQAIAKVLHGRTAFIIAHRLSTVRSADRILFIEDGRIVEEGTHASLMERKGAYWRLYTNQFMEERSADALTEAASAPGGQ